MQSAEFSIPGEAKAKARPRFAKGSGRTYTPKTTLYYENLVKVSFMEQCKTWQITDKPCAAVISAFFPIPKSTTKARKALMQLDKIKPTRKPDLDNIAKSILDSLNGIAWQDDSQIVNIWISKHYDVEPHTEVLLLEVDVCQ